MSQEHKELRPMLALPMGQQDFDKVERLLFLQSCRSLLERLGWTIGVELWVFRAY